MDLVPQTTTPRALISELLNDDLLREIFDCVAIREPYERHRYSWKLLHGLGWVRLGHVCHSWRQLLLAMPTLWGRIALVNVGAPFWAFTVLMRRSKEAPLHARCEGLLTSEIDGHEERLKHLGVVVRTAQQFVSRLESLTALQIHLLHLIPFFKGGPLPSLKSLHIWHPVGEPEVLDTDVVVDACNLVIASFELSGQGLPTASRFAKGLRFKLPNLRELYVDWQSIFPVNEQSPAEDLRWIPAILGSSPLLRRLTVNLGLWRYDADWRSLFEGRTVSLHHLKSLSLTQRSMRSHSGNFLSHIDASPPAFTFAARYLSRPDIVPLLEALEPRLREAASYSTLYIRFPHPMWVMLHVLPDPDNARTLAEEKAFGRSPERNLSKLERHTSLSLFTYADLLLAVEVLPDLAPRLQFANLTHLRVNGNVNPSGWWFGFQQLVAPRMTAVHTFTIDNLSWLAPKLGSKNALSIIGPHETSSSTEDNGVPSLGPPLPALRTLIVTIWVTGSKSRKRIGSIYLLMLLKHRQDIGIPVHDIYLKGGWMTPELRKSNILDHEILRRMATHVTGKVFDERVVFSE